jgi:predicted NBD/HSP70 family sugar kinase
MLCLGVDIGGTKSAVVLASGGGALRSRKQCAAGLGERGRDSAAPPAVRRSLAGAIDP